jgi:hypothetical protein
MQRSRFFRELLGDKLYEIRRSAVLEALETRFGSQAAQTLSPLLAEVMDEKQLIHLLRRAIQCGSPEEFQASLDIVRREGEQSSPRRRRKTR